MDEYFEYFLDDENFGPGIKPREVRAEVIEAFKGALPDALLDYWALHGWRGYANGLLWTVNPADWQETLDKWLAGTPFVGQDDFYVIARSAFGELIVWGRDNGQCLKILPTYGMIFPSFNKERFHKNGADASIRFFFAACQKDAYEFKDENGAKLFDRVLEANGELDHDTMYGFVPALVLGGKADLGRIQVLDADVHLNILAQMTERQIMLDIAKEVREQG